MNEPQFIPSPLPEPSLVHQDGVAKKAAHVGPLGSAAMMLLFSAFLRVAVDATYIIGAVMAKVSMAQAVFQTVIGAIHLVVVLFAFLPLRRGSETARNLATVMCALLIPHAANDLWKLMRMRLMGYSNTETQLCFLLVLIVSLLLALYYLWRAPVSKKV
ncbi:MAG TPA: hypothetical protein VF681_13590 [Abditibacteriaceae bacterium]|jgi:hypothetical protein